MKNQVETLLWGIGFSKDHIKSLSLSKDENIKQVLGSGPFIDRAICDTCRNGKLLFMKEWFYEFCKKKSLPLFENQTVILFGSKKYTSMQKGKTLALCLPFNFAIDDCVAINEKNDNLCISKELASYESSVIEFPLAYTSAAIDKKSNIVLPWLEKEVIKASQKDISFLSIFGLGFLNKAEMENFLTSAWTDKNVDQILSDVFKITNACIKNGFEVVKIDGLASLLSEKLNTIKDVGGRIAKIQALASSPAVAKGDSFHVELARKALGLLKEKPNNYEGLKKLQDKLGIESHDVAIIFDELINPLYTQSVICTIMSSMMSGKQLVDREFFSFDEFFIDYWELLGKIQFLVDQTNLFAPQDSQCLRKAAMEAPNLSLLHSCILQLRAKNALLIDYDVNIYSLMKKIDTKKAICFFQNLDIIEKAVLDRFAGIIPSDDEIPSFSKRIPDHIAEKIYVIDTCALINSPEILQSFAPDEYIRIPIQVLVELGKIKDKRSKQTNSNDAPHIARRLVKDIESALKDYSRFNELIILTEESFIDLLPFDLKPDVNDHLILSIALAYKNWDVYLLTDDKQFALIAEQYDIKCITGQQFLQTHKKYFRPREKMHEKYDSINGPSTIVVNFQKVLYGEKYLNKVKRGKSITDLCKVVKSEANSSGAAISDSNKV
jgi:Predicted ATPase related to phosphate starvation-inducible protein PhoH